MQKNFIRRNIELYSQKSKVDRERYPLRRDNPIARNRTPSRALAKPVTE